MIFQGTFVRWAWTSEWTHGVGLLTRSNSWLVSFGILGYPEIKSLSLDIQTLAEKLFGPEKIPKNTSSGGKTGCLGCNLYTGGSYNPKCIYTQ